MGINQRHSLTKSQLLVKLFIMTGTVVRENRLPPTDLLIVLGKNLGIGSTPEDMRRRHDHLSRESRINALAAGELWTPGTDILFSGGHTAGPSTPSEAGAMRDYFMSLYPKVPGTHLLTEENSIDTAGNAEEIAKILAERRYKRIGLITVGYHLDNAATLLRNYGVSLTDTYASEEAMRARSNHHDSYSRKWAETERVRKEYRKEAVRKKLLVVDRKGRAVHLIAGLTRK